MSESEYNNRREIKTLTEMNASVCRLAIQILEYFYDLHLLLYISFLYGFMLEQSIPLTLIDNTITIYGPRSAPSACTCRGLLRHRPAVTAHTQKCKKTADP